jgi:hypothetical protein
MRLPLVQERLQTADYSSMSPAVFRGAFMCVTISQIVPRHLAKELLLDHKVSSSLKFLNPFGLRNILVLGNSVVFTSFACSSIQTITRHEAN